MTPGDDAVPEPVPGVLPVQARLFGQVFVLTGRLGARMDRQLAELGLTTRQWLLLAVLDAGFADRAPTLTEAAAAYGSSRQNVKAIAEGLAARGWLRLEPDPADRRATRLRLTDRIEVFREPAMEQRAAGFLAAVYQGMSDTDTRALQALVDRWLAQLDAVPSSAVPSSAVPTTTLLE